MSLDKGLFVRGLVLAVVLVNSVLILLPEVAKVGSGVAPDFSRPNVLVDTGPGPIRSTFRDGPDIAAGPSGVLYAAWSDMRTGHWGIYFSKSYDGGFTWTGEMKVDGRNWTEHYRPSIAVDTSGGQYNGNIYIAWELTNMSSTDIYAMRSMDGGATWMDRMRVDGASAYNDSDMPDLAVDSDGVVYLAFYDRRKLKYDVYVARSVDGGATWYPEKRMSMGTQSNFYPSMSAYGGLACVAWHESGAPLDRLWMACTRDDGLTWSITPIFTWTNGQGYGMWVSILVGKNGTIHAAWVEENTLLQRYIVYSRCADGGKNWSPRVQVNDAPAASGYMANELTILELADTVYIVWDDRRNGDYDIFTSWSEDGGSTWGDGLMNNNDLRVDDTDDNTNTTDDASWQMYPSATASPYGIYAIWSDNRNGLAYHAYTSSFDKGKLLVTEIRDSPDGSEQVEIFNRFGATLDLTGWEIQIGATSIDLSPLGSLPPSGYATVGDPASSDLVVGITLPDEGGIIEVKDASGSSQDVVSYGQLGPTPDPISTESTARIPFDGAYTKSWARDATPSFGGSNGGGMPIPEPSVVLNEVFFNALNPNDRFIELYLRNESPLNIGNYVLAGDVAVSLPSMTLTNTSPYFPLLPSQAPGLFAQMDVNGDNLYLYDTAGRLVDMVGWTSSHMQGSSMTRVPEGFGTADGFDDGSSYAAGWRFNQTPSLPLVLIGPRQSKAGDLGDLVFYTLIVTNKETSSSFVNIQAQIGAQGWNMVLYEADGVTPLADSPGDADSIADVGLLPPNGSATIQVSVEIPFATQTVDWESGSVIATVAGDPLARAMVGLVTTILPYESLSASVNPTQIWVANSPPAFQPKDSTLTLKLSGRGLPYTSKKPVDVILIIDSSGSMMENDPKDLRLEAAKHYVDTLIPPDRAAVIDFDSDAVLVNGDHLSSNYTRIKANIDTIDSGGSTDILAALKAGYNELVGYGNRSHVWVEILLTDGNNNDPNALPNILAEASKAASKGITIYTIGLLGSGGVDEDLLQQIAEYTDGVYLRARTANDLDAIYQMIGNFVYNIAGYDDNVLDYKPMVSVFLPDYIIVVGNVIPSPSYLGKVGGMTNIQWNVSKVSINETWTANLLIRSNITGFGLPVMSYPESKVSYFRYDDVRVDTPFPQTYIDVLTPPPRPDLVVYPFEIEFSPLFPFPEGTTVLINSTIRNIGNMASGQTVVRYYDGRPPIQIGSDLMLGVIPVNGSEVVSQSWLAFPQGSHWICVNADPDNLVDEADEMNNMACVLVIVLPPITARSDYEPVLAQPSATIKVGLSLPVNLSIQVFNDGNLTPAVDSTLAFHNESALPFKEFSVSPIPPAMTSPRFSATWISPAIEGVYRVIADVDYYDDLVEWDETNNVFMWTIEVAKGPITSIIIGTPNYTSTATYLKSSTPLSFAVIDQSGMGINFTRYRVDGGSWKDYVDQFFLTGEGEHVVDWFSVDNIGNVETMNSKTFSVDDTPPSTTILIGSPKYLVGGNFITSSTPLTLQASDGGITPVGVGSTRYRIDGGGWKVYSSSLFLTGEGVRIIDFYSQDLLTNEEVSVAIQVIIDDTSPATVLSIGEPRYLVGGNFVRTTTPLGLEATDGGISPVGLGVTAFRIWNGAWSLWHDYVSAIVLEGSDGIRYLEYASTDMLGNAEEVRNATLIVDDTPPAIGIQPEASRVSEDVSFLLTADDGQGCGVARLEYSIDEGEWMQYSMPFILELGQHIIKYRSWDNLNNSAERVHSVNVVTADLPPDTDVAVNYKPVIAFLFSILLAVAGEISAKRKPLRWPKSRMTFLSSWSVISLPFVVAEAATGLLSLFIESLRVPPILGLGMGVDCAILAVGIAFMLVRLRMPPSDECGESSPDQA